MQKYVGRAAEKKTAHIPLHPLVRPMAETCPLYPQRVRPNSGETGGSYRWSDKFIYIKPSPEMSERAYELCDSFCDCGKPMRDRTTDAISYVTVFGSTQLHINPDNVRDRESLKQPLYRHSHQGDLAMRTLLAPYILWCNVLPQCLKE